MAVILYGSVPAVAVNQTAEGEFLVSGMADSVELSTNGTSWVPGGTGVTRLGGTYTAAVLNTSATESLVVVVGTPTSVGTASLYVRVAEGGVPSVAYGPVEVRAFASGSIEGSPLTLETSSNSTAFVYAIANPVNSTAEPTDTDSYWLVVSPTVYAVTGGFRARFRVGGSTGTIYTSPLLATSNGTVACLRMNVDGTVETVLWCQQLSSITTSRDRRYLFVHGNGGSPGPTLYNPDGTLVYSPPSPAGPWVALFDASLDVWSWSAGWTNVTPQFIAMDDFPVVSFTVASNTTATGPGGFSYANTSSFSRALLVRLFTTTGNVSWHKVASSTSSNINVGANGVAVRGSAVYFNPRLSSSSATLNFDGNTTATGRGLYRVNDTTQAVTWAVDLSAVYFMYTTDAGANIRVNSSDVVFATARQSTTKTWGTNTIPSAGTFPSVLLAASTAAGAATWMFDAVARGFTGVSNTHLRRQPGFDDLWYFGGEGSTNTSNRIAIFDGTSVINADATKTSTTQPLTYVPVGGGAVTVHLQTGGTITLTSADSTTSTAAMRQEAHQFLSDTGIWSEIAGGDGIDPGNAGLAEPSRPASTNWPSTAEENAGWLADVTGYDPELSTTPGVLQVWRWSTSTWETGTVDLGKYVVSVTDLSMGLGDGALAASVMASTDAGWYGTATVSVRWKVGTRTGPVKTFTTTVTNIPEATDAPDGVTFDTVENEPVEKWVSFADDPDFVGTYTWQLSPQTEAPYSTTGTSITVLDGALTAGTAEIVSVDNANQRARVRYSPGDWNGYTSFSIRVSNGVWSSWTSLSVNVASRADAPTAPTGTVPALAEDGTVEMVISWTDADNLDGTMSAQDGYQLRLAPVDSGFTDLDFVDVGKVIVRVLSYSESALQATVRLEAKANQTGSFSFRAQVKDTTDPTVKRSPITTFTGTIGSVADTPEQPLPSRMPLARPEQSVTQTFTTRDPDDSDTSWTFEIAAIDSTSWGSTLTIPQVGTLTVVDTNTGNKNADVRLDQISGGATVSRYQFKLRVTDSSARTSATTIVTGYVATPAAGVWLQQVTRTSGTATIGTLTPLTTVRSLSATESLAGPGDAEVTVSAGEVAARAAALGVTVADLLEPGAIELLIAAGGETVWVGPVTDVSWDAAADEVTISARGLLSYLEARFLPADVTYTNVNGSAIVADLVADEQARPYGSIAVTDATVETTANHTLEFTAGTSVLEAIYEVADQVDGPEVWIDADRQLRSATTRGIDNRDRVRVTSGMCQVVSWSGQGDDIVTAATVTGQGTATGSYADASAMARFGRVERVVEAKQLTSNAACAALAQKIVEASARQAVSLSVQVPLTPDRPFGPSDVEVGNRVTVDVWDPQLGQVLGTYRIVNRSLELDGETFRARLDLEPVPVIGGNLRVIPARSRHNPEVMYLLSDLQALR